MPAPADLRVGEGFVEPIGFHDATSTLSWKLPADAGAKQQSAYRIVAGSKAELLPDKPDLWDSGQVVSKESAWVPYAGKPLKSRQSVYWQVMFWDQDGKASPWSKPARFELGLLDLADWQAQWIHLKPANKRTDGKEQTKLPGVVIEKALYGEQGKPENLIDLTAKLNQLISEGNPTIKVNNDLAGRDPIFGVAKSLALVVCRDGKPEETVLPEDQSYDLVTGGPPAAPAPFVPQHLRREFSLDKPVRSARLHVTARGVFEIHLNGSKVGNDFMAPGWTPYARKFEAITYDVTGQLRQGKNDKGQSHISTYFVFVEEEMPLCLSQFEGVSSPGSNVGQCALRDRSFVL